MGKVKISKNTGRPSDRRAKPVAAKAGLSRDPRRRYDKGGKVKQKSA